MEQTERDRIKAMILNYCKEAIGQYIENEDKRGRHGVEAIEHAIQHVERFIDRDLGKL